MSDVNKKHGTVKQRQTTLNSFTKRKSEVIEESGNCSSTTSLDQMVPSESNSHSTQSKSHGKVKFNFDFTSDPLLQAMQRKVTNNEKRSDESEEDFSVGRKRDKGIQSNSPSQKTSLKKKKLNNHDQPHHPASFSDFKTASGRPVDKEVRNVTSSEVNTSSQKGRDREQRYLGSRIMTVTSQEFFVQHRKLFTADAIVFLIMPTFLLVFYVVVLRCFISDRMWMKLTAYRLMVQIGILDCIELIAHFFSGIIEFQYVQNNGFMSDNYKIISKVIGGLLNGAWYLLAIVKLILAFDRFVSMAKPHWNEIVLSWNKVTVERTFCWSSIEGRLTKQVYFFVTKSAIPQVKTPTMCAHIENLSSVPYGRSLGGFELAGMN
ncbi:unnamed protein product [Anisakis simplex]|uniref:Ion_trans domain-containing protein n=1 Tax=Anisakis simplex TaxID=6269 RepID=A0A0M3K178_ANISI|nr:unnamed protein product [Anisakis simplex]